MNKGCDKMQYCQFYKEHVAGRVQKDRNGNVYSAPMEYGTYCSSFDNYEKCPYYSYKNFNNQQIRDQYKKNQKDASNGSLITLIIIVVVIVLVLKRCGAF